MDGGSPTLPRREFALLFAVLLAVAAGNTALQSILPSIGRELRIDDILIASVFSLSALWWTLTAPYWARRSDTHGRKALMRVGLAGFAISMFLCGISIYAGLHGWTGPLLTFAIFISARSLFGIFGSASNPAAQAYISSRTDPADRTRYLSILSSAFGLGTILGPALAPFLVLPVLGLSGPLFIFSLIAFSVLIALERLLPDDRPDVGNTDRGAPASQPMIGVGPSGANVTAASHGRPPRMKWNDQRVLPFMIYGFSIGSIQAGTGQTLGFYMIDIMALSPSIAQQYIGVALMAGAVATLFAQWALIPMLNLQPRALMRAGAILATLGTLMTGLTDSFGGIVTAFALTSLGYGFARPGFTAGSSLAVGHEDQGAVAGLVTSVNGGAFIVAPALAIALYQLYAPLPFLIGAALLGWSALYCFSNDTLKAARSD